MEFLLNRDTTAEVETPSGWAPLGVAFKSVYQSRDEEVYKRTYLDGSRICRVVSIGFAARFSGDYTSGDKACGWLFSPGVMYGIGAARETRLRLARGGAEQVIPVTITKLEESGGSLNTPAKITAEFRSR